MDTVVGLLGSADVNLRDEMVTKYLQSVRHKFSSLLRPPRVIASWHFLEKK